MNPKQSEALRRLFAVNVSELELSVSIYGVLESHEIHTIYDILETTESKFIKILGKRRTEEIKDKLRQLGLSLRSTEHIDP